MKFLDGRKIKLNWRRDEMKKGVTYGEYLFGKKEHKKQMRRVKQGEKEMKHCRNCRFYTSALRTTDGWDRCKIHQHDLLSPTSGRNKNNDCSQHERKWWKFWVK